LAGFYRDAVKVGRCFLNEHLSRFNVAVETKWPVGMLVLQHKLGKASQNTAYLICKIVIFSEYIHQKFQNLLKTVEIRAKFHNPSFRSMTLTSNILNVKNCFEKSYYFASYL
jgi:hypothetical protein